MTLSSEAASERASIEDWVKRQIADLEERLSEVGTLEAKKLLIEQLRSQTLKGESNA